MDGLIVGFRRKRLDDLEREAHTEGDRAGAKGGERAVVKTTAAAEAPAAGGEGESRDQKTVEGREADPFAVEGLLESAVGVRCGVERLRAGGLAPEEG